MTQIDTLHIVLLVQCPTWNEMIAASPYSE